MSLVASSSAAHPIAPDSASRVTAWGIPLMLSSVAGEPVDDAHKLFRSAKSGSLVRVRPGVFAPTDAWNTSTPARRHMASATALALAGRSEAVFCRETALLLYRLPLHGIPRILRRRATSPSTAGHTQRTRTEHSGPPLLSEQQVSIPARWPAHEYARALHFRQPLLTGTELVAEDIRYCLADVLPRLDRGHAVMVADALMSGLRRTDDDKLARLASPWTRRHLSDLAELAVSGKAARRLQWLAEFATPLSGSPGESLSRYTIHDVGFASPELQHEVRDEKGRLVAYTDFWWTVDGRGVAGEFDGIAKYAGQSSYSGEDRDVVFRAEKNRGERIQEQGIRLVRWVTEDVRTPRRLYEKLVRAGVPRRS
jgi:hypothetical protein